jgi:hypothetical protein
VTHLTADAILRQIEAMGHATSAHRMGRYVELHAVRLTAEEMPHVARCEGDGDEELCLAACELAGMVGLRLEE